MGLPATYGLRGCEKYDVGRHVRDAHDCAAASSRDITKLFCFKPWCYVDMEVCGVNASECSNIGSSVGPSCRSRPTRKTVFPGLDLRFSYQTCGALDSYNVAQIFAPQMQDRTLLVAPLTGKPIVYAGSDGWTGSFVEFTRISLESFNGAAIEFADPVVSQESMDEINGSQWTACVHDVGIGRLDMCIGDFWVTAERLKMATFLATMYDDPQSFLMKTRQEESVGEILAKPFAPLMPETWAFIFAFLVAAAVVYFLVEGAANTDEFPPEKPTTANVCLSIYYGLASFFGDAPSPQTPAGRLIAIGIGFFVLISTSSYTANLATVLLTKSLKSTVNSFEEAVEANLHICVDLALASMVEELYPQVVEKGLLVKATWTECPGMIHRGEVDGLIFHRSAMDSMCAGVFVKGDCGAGSVRASDAKTCPKADGELDLSRDCSIRRVGDAPFSLGISMPVTRELQHALSWSTTKVISTGRFKAVEASFKSESQGARNVCPSDSSVGDAQALGIGHMMGTFLVASILVGAGLVTWALQRVFGVAKKVSRKVSTVSVSKVSVFRDYDP